MSGNDVSVSTSLQIPVYGVDAMSGKVGKSAGIHRANPDGSINNNVGSTIGTGKYQTTPTINLGRNAMEIWGNSKNQLISMLDKFIFFVLLLGITSHACSQNNEKILYMLPDDVEVQASNYIKRVSKQQEYLFYFVLNKKPDTTYRLDIVHYKAESSKGLIYWVKSTNRHVVVNQERYPLLLDYDYLFSTKQPSNIGNYGEREGQILITMPIHVGFYIDFNKDGIVKTK